jgi:lipopolysaccharide export system protein LptA
VRSSPAISGSSVALAFLGLLMISAGSRGAESSPASEPTRAGNVAPEAGTSKLRWSARLAELDPAEHVMTLTGDVLIQLPRLELGAQRVEARYDSGPDLRSLSSQDQVTLRLGQTSVSASGFELELRQHQLRLAGPVQISLGGVSTSAERAEVDTETGRLTLHRVKGSLSLGTAIPAASAR